MPAWTRTTPATTPPAPEPVSLENLDTALAPVPGESAPAAKPPVPQLPEQKHSTLTESMRELQDEVAHKSRRIDARLARARTVSGLTSPNGRKIYEQDMTKLMTMKSAFDELFKRLGECIELETVDHVTADPGNGK